VSTRQSCDNDLNSAGGHALPADDVPLREETVPIHNIELSFSLNYKIRSIRLEPQGQTLTPKTNPQGTIVTVPELVVHAMVVAELE
jgi:hypothetical protein